MKKYSRTKTPAVIGVGSREESREQEAPSSAKKVLVDNYMYANTPVDKYTNTKALVDKRTHTKTPVDKYMNGKTLVYNHKQEQAPVEGYMDATSCG